MKAETEQQQQIEIRLLETGWIETTSDCDKIKGKKMFSKKGYRVYFDYINTFLINKNNSRLFGCIRLSEDQLNQIFKI